MKVYSLYYKDTFVAAFPERKDAIFYGKQFYEDAWDCNIVEEYLSKSPLVYTPPHYTPPHWRHHAPCMLHWCNTCLPLSGISSIIILRIGA